MDYMYVPTAIPLTQVERSIEGTLTVLTHGKGDKADRGLALLFG
jgi:hypothetical protein